MKTGKKLLSLLLILVMVLSLTVPALAAGPETIYVNAVYGSNTQKYGHIDLDISTEEFLQHYSYGDVVHAWINGHQYTLPVCSNYDDVDANYLLVRAAPGKDVVTLAINYGQLAVDSGLCVYDSDSGYYVPKNDGTFPHQVQIIMWQEGGYYDQWNARQLPDRTNVRSDYASLTDAEFANVRNVATTGMGYGILYRGSSPINPEIGRNTYADAAAQAYGIKTFINLADSEAAAQAYEGYADTYYSTQDAVFLNMPVSYTSNEFLQGLATGYRYIASHSGPYYIHCTEGKDRCGIATAVLECLMGASYDEVVADYLVTYYNYYGIAPDSEKATSVANAGVVSALETLFITRDLPNRDLVAEAEDFLRYIGMTDTEIAALKANLSKSSVTIGGLDNNVWMTKYGNVYTDCTSARFSALGFEWGDLVKVSFLDKELVLPVVPIYSYVDSGKPAIILPKGADGNPTGYVSLAINMGNFAQTYGIAEKHTNADKSWYWTACDGVTFPVELSFAMSEKDGYRDEFLLHDLQRTNVREDYPDLTDAEFANFRNVATTGMGAYVLYRGSSPINPELGRNGYADKALSSAGVTVIMNLANDEATASAYEGFADTYYAGQKVIYLNLGVDFKADEFKAGLADGLRFFAENKGVYYVHCTEGKDRAGFVSALLECFMGASYDEVVSDYMTTYYNYYGVEKDTEKYNVIASANIIKSLENAFGVEDLSKADLKAEAEAFFKEIGLSDAELAALRENLSENSITIGGLDNDTWMTKYGNVNTDCTAERFTAMGYKWGDLVKVRFLNKELVLPVVPTYSYVNSGEPAIILPKGEDGNPTGYVSLAINMGNFAQTYGIAVKHTNADKTWYWTACDGVTFPVNVSFTMSEKDGYLSQYIIHDLQRTNVRSDYPNLSNAEFANFRNVATTGMGAYVLYRGSSPISPEIGRNSYADKALRGAGVTVIMNLANDEATASAYEGFADTYYSAQKVIYLNLGVDFKADDFKEGLADGLRFFAENKGVYYVHCTEGKDRAGFVSALLECFMGASYDEVVADYMTTYYNYYGVEVGTDKYDAISSSNIVKSLEYAFGVSDLKTADLAAEAAAFFKEIGLSDSEIAALKANLSADHYAFSDIKDNYFRDYITTAANLGLVNGMGDGTYLPDASVTRAQFVTMLYRISGQSVKDGYTLDFVDADTILDCYRDAVAWGVENGIIKGFEDKSFRPDEVATREQMAAFVYRYLLAFGNYSDEETAELLKPYGFTDSADVSSWFVDAVNFTVNLGVFTGYPEGDFKPALDASRGMAAAIMLRLYDL